MRRIIEAAATFTNLGDIVTIAQPIDGEEVALRLFNGGMTVAIIAIIPDPDVSPATSPRKFLLTASAIIPDNFVKYIGALLFGPDKKQAYILEIS